MTLVLPRAGPRRCSRRPIRSAPADINIRIKAAFMMRASIRVMVVVFLPTGVSRTAVKSADMAYTINNVAPNRRSSPTRYRRTHSTTRVSEVPIARSSRESATARAFSSM
jgi:hypothetical protein